MNGLGFFVFGRFVAYYGLMIVVGILAGAVVGYVQVKRFRLDMNDLILISALSGLFGIIGAKLLYLIVTIPKTDFSKFQGFSDIGNWMRGGFVFLGGVIGMLLALCFCAKKLHIPMQPYVQACMACFPIGHGFGRIGCYLVGCCYGVPYDGPFAVIYTSSAIAPNGVPLFPVQLAEALLEFVIGGVLLIFSRKLRGNSAVLVYLIVYAVVRFALEFLRYDSARGGVGGISTSQLLSVILFCASLVFLFRARTDGTADKAVD